MKEPSAVAYSSSKDQLAMLRVLFLEHSQLDVELCLEELKKAGIAVTGDIVQTPEEFIERLQAITYDIILADFRLPNWTGMDAFRLLRKLGKDIPFVLVTGTLGEENAVECIKEGVTDYILKERLTRLPIAVQGALREKALREERAHAEVALQQSEASFRLLFADNPLPMWVYDEETLQFLQVNDAAITHYGYSRQEFLSMRITDIRPPEDVPRLLEIVNNRASKIRQAGQWRHALKDGRVIDVEILSHALHFTGRPAVLVVAQDITERKRAEQENARLITAIEQSAEGILVTDPEGRILYSNPAFSQMTGYNRDEVTGQNPRFLKSGKHPPGFYQHMWTTILSGKTWRGWVTNRRKDGSLYTEEESITPVRDDRGVITHFIAIKQDITERQRAEQALRESEARYRNLVENATSGILTTDSSGRFRDVNPALLQMLRHDSKHELMARSFAEIYRDPADLRRHLDEYRRAGRIQDAEAEWKRKDGSFILVRLSGRAVLDEHGRPQAHELIVEDITARRALEKQLQQAQKYEAIGQLAGGIAHDFNNVIGAILGWAEMGEEQTSTETRLCTHFRKIREQAERAASLTRQLLAFARRQILEPHEVNLNQVVAGLLGLLEKVISKDIEIKVVLAPDLQIVRADPTQFEQVLMNLCLNARDAMPKGGRLVIETRNFEMDEDYCRAHAYTRPGSYARLSVTDTGIGMDAATREHIFEPFFTTKPMGKGTGLGLATVYGVVKQHNGFIQVYSEPGQGSTFSVYLPIVASAQASDLPQSPKVEEPVRGGTEVILLAEDHDGLRELARMTLEGLGYQVLVAEDGETALRLFWQHAASVALALLDVVMPKLSGREAYARMCALKPQLPVLFTTGYTSEGLSLDAIEENGGTLLQKPYTPALLARKVREVLDRAALAASHSSPSRDSA